MFIGFRVFELTKPNCVKKIIEYLKNPLNFFSKKLKKIISIFRPKIIIFCYQKIDKTLFNIFLNDDISKMIKYSRKKKFS